MAHTWWYNDVSGLVAHQTNALLQAALSKTPSWHGFDTKAAADAYKKAHPASFGAVGDAANITNPVQITGFLSALTQPATWIRAAEIIIGVVLIAVGVAQMTHAVPAATKIARMVI